MPVHPFLFHDLKLIDYVQHLKVKGEKRLFPELKRRRDGYGQTVSKWFSRYKNRNLDIKEDEKKDFHSFRHTFTDNLKQSLNVPDVMISELVGHSVDSITMTRYGKRYDVEGLFDAISKVKYDVDLSHLKKSGFVKGV